MPKPLKKFLSFCHLKVVTKYVIIVGNDLQRNVSPIIVRTKKQIKNEQRSRDSAAANKELIQVE